MRRSVRSAKWVIGVCVAGLLPAGCRPGQQITPLTTSVQASVGTLVKSSGVIDVSNTCTPAVPPSPNIQNSWGDRRFPLVGFELWRNTTDACTSSRLDVYRALVTFNTGAVSNLRGLVTKAELIVASRILPAGVGAHTSCSAFIGGAGSLERFGPAAAATLPPVAGTLTVLSAPTPFPVGNTVFVIPRPCAAGPVPGAASPASTLASGTGGATFTVDVTNQVVTALNGGIAGLSWMLTSAVEGPLTAPVPGSVDCKTPYSFALRLTHY